MRSGRRPILGLLLASELQGVLADGFAEGLVHREADEPSGLRWAMVSQEVNQAQCLTTRVAWPGEWPQHKQIFPNFRISVYSE